MRPIAVPIPPEGATIAWQPFPGFQERVCRNGADELLIGGAKGSGKSVLLGARPLRQAHKPLYAGALIRESYKELQRLLDYVTTLYKALPASQRPAWNGEKHRFTFPSGAIVQAGYASTLKDISWTQGGNWAEILYDEVGNQPNEKVVDQLISEIRCPDPTIRRQFVGSANPGFAGHPWIMRRFIKPCGLQGERVSYFKVTLPDGQTVWRSRAFVPGRVTDNPVYANDRQYMAALMLLPDRMRKCLLDGDWMAATGMALDELDPTVHLVTPFECPAHWPHIAAFDWGYAHWAVMMWGRVSDDGRVFITGTWKRRLLRDWDLASAALELVPPDALTHVHAGHDCWNDIRARGENAPQTAQYFDSQGVHLVHANIARSQGYKNVLQYLAWRESEYLPQRQPMVQFFDTPIHRWLIEEHLPAQVMDPDDPTDVLKVNADGEDGSGGDDGYDCLRMLLASRPMKAESMIHLIKKSAWDPDVLRKEAEKFYRPVETPRKPYDGVFLGG